MSYYIFEVRFPLEQDENCLVNPPPMETARGIFKACDIDLSQPCDHVVRMTVLQALIESFKKTANTKEHDTIEYKGQITDPEIIATLDIWMRNRHVLDPVGLLSDD